MIMKSYLILLLIVIALVIGGYFYFADSIKYLPPSASQNITNEDAAIALVKQLYPELEQIRKTQDNIGKLMDINTKTTSDGWKILFWQGWVTVLLVV